MLSPLLWWISDLLFALKIYYMAIHVVQFMTYSEDICAFLLSDIYSLMANIIEYTRKCLHKQSYLYGM